MSAYNILVAMNQAVQIEQSACQQGLVKSGHFSMSRPISADLPGLAIITGKYSATMHLEALIKFRKRDNTFLNKNLHMGLEELRFSPS